MRIALLFWGLIRGLKHTIESIRKNVIMPLKNGGYEVDVFLHTYYFDGLYSNVRHKVRNVKLDFDEYKMLNPKYYIVENQDVVKKRINLQKYRKRPDHFKNNYQSNDYHILALYSQQQVTRLFDRFKDEYNYCFYLRPDVLFMHKFDIKWLQMIKENRMVVPGWKHYKHKKEYAENNRMCICHPKDAYKYGDILKFLLPYSTIESIVAEFFLGFIFNLYYKIEIRRIGYTFKRVLPDGRINEMDARMR